MDQLQEKGRVETLIRLLSRFSDKWRRDYLIPGIVVWEDGGRKPSYYPILLMIRRYMLTQHACINSSVK